MVTKYEMFTKLRKLKDGFTLLETILYVAILLSFMLASFMVVEELLADSRQNRDYLEVTEEAEFIGGKINWMFSSAKYLTQPATNTTAAIIDIITPSGETRRLYQSGEDIFMSLNQGAATQLNSPAVKIANFTAQNIYDIDTNEALVKVNLKVEREPTPELEAVIASTTLETTYEIQY